jgi:hypothetical protein
MFASKYQVEARFSNTLLWTHVTAAKDAKLSIPQRKSVRNDSRTSSTTSSTNTSRRHGQYVKPYTYDMFFNADRLRAESKNSSQHNQSKKAHRNG